MFSCHFGAYLLSRKLIDTHRLREAMAALSTANARLGVLAIEAEMMTAPQVEEVHTLQRSKDKRFGEIAIECGYLTREHLEELLNWQSMAHLTLSQILVDNGWFTLDAIQEVLAAYKADSGCTEDEFDALMRNDVDKVVGALLQGMPPAPSSMDQVQTQLRSYVLSTGVLQDCVSLFVRNVVRFVDPHVLIAGATCAPSVESSWAVVQRIEGVLPLTTAITGDAAALSAFGGRFAGLSLRAMDLMAQDAVAEFLNCNNGLFLSKISNQGMELDLLPPRPYARCRLDSDETIFVIPFTLPFGDFQFLVGRGHTAIS